MTTGPDSPDTSSAFEPPAGLPFPSGEPVDEGDEGTDSGGRRRVLWAFGAAAALFGAGVIGLALPTGSNEGVNVNTDDTVGPSTTSDLSAPNDDIRTLVAPVFAPFTFSADNAANTTTTAAPGTTATVPTSGPPTGSILAGVSATGLTSITITPPPPVTSKPSTPVVPAGPGGGPAPGTSAPPMASSPHETLDFRR